jgi:hypothetical protein
MNLSVKYGRETLSLALSHDTTVAELQDELEKLTGLMVSISCRRKLPPAAGHRQPFARLPISVSTLQPFS